PFRDGGSDVRRELPRQDDEYGEQHDGDNADHCSYPRPVVDRIPFTGGDSTMLPVQDPGHRVNTLRRAGRRPVVRWSALAPAVHERPARFPEVRHNVVAAPLAVAALLRRTLLESTTCTILVSAVHCTLACS